jgi:2-dehydro-3-deoxyphosphogluconate aldolase / (4S)-4-hydroxy-2-oxoglutarate aldolase
MSAPKTRPPVPDLILESRVVAVSRGLTADDAPAVGAALAAGGVSAIEITLNEPLDRALRAIERLVRAAASFGGLVGAGTVLSVEAAERAVAAGSRFIVTPHTDGAIIRWCVERGIPCLPGALTPTEIHAAWQAGASAVKLFPASAVGPGYIGLIGGPFPEIPLVPTGGVSAETAGAWIEAGALAVGMGAWLIGDRDPAGITARARSVRAAVDRAAGAARSWGASPPGAS